MGGDEDRSAEVRAEESVSGGVDVWSDAVSSHAPDHLLVMVHGILGRCARALPRHLWLSTPGFLADSSFQAGHWIGLSPGSE